ncbi:MAG TPA: hypothetical protein VFQ13_21675 [Anaerolineales bacterium]|nr:hypothetical protein [Anaerolineales bacterium]
MNDEFLTKFQKVPRAGFAEALYKQISKPEVPTSPRSFVHRLTFRNAIFVVLFLISVAACLRAVTQLWHREKIGDIWVEVQSGEIEISTQEIAPLDGVVQGDDTLPLAEAEETYRFDIKVPTWMPEGFTWDGNATVWGMGTGTTANVLWDNSWTGAGIVLTAQSLKYWNPAKNDYMYKSPYTPRVAPGSYEEVKINGQPAVLIRGNWIPKDNDFESSTLEWDRDAALLLCWSEDGFLYWLWLDGDSVSVNDLLKMAESAQ